MPTATSNAFDGIVSACFHEVTFRYWDFDAELTPELESELRDHAEEHATEMLSTGAACCGELNCLHVDDDGSEEEIRGWWETAHPFC